jgi:hypothetical protein
MMPRRPAPGGHERFLSGGAIPLTKKPPNEQERALAAQRGGNLCYIYMQRAKVFARCARSRVAVALLFA